MKSFSKLSIALSLCATSLLANAQTTAIKAGHLVDVLSGKVKSNRVIIVKDNIIQTIQAADKPLPANAKIIDLSDSYVMPGFMDMHTHVVAPLTKGFFSRYFTNPHRATIGGVVNAEKTLMAGFTTIRNVGAADYMDVALRDSINAGEVPGPRMAVSGPSLGITGGHCDGNALNHNFKERSQGVANGPWQVREAVRKNVKYGVDLIKFCATGGVFSKGTHVGMRQYTLEEMKALVDEAHMHGRTVAAHAHGTEGIRFAIEAGVDSIEHASFLDKETIKLAKKKGVYLSMDIYNTEYTLSEGKKNGVPQENIDKEKQVGTRQRESFSAAVNAGAKVVLGSDAGVYPHGDNGKQFARMITFGMEPMQAVQAATIESARLLKWQDKLGSISQGKLADIVAIKGNPFAKPELFEKVSFIMKDGKVYKH